MTWAWSCPYVPWCQCHRNVPPHYSTHSTGYTSTFPMMSSQIHLQAQHQAHGCVHQCWVDLPSNWMGKRKQARTEGSLRGNACYRFPGAGGNQERAAQPLPLQIATTREHSAPRNGVCRVPGTGPARLCSAPTPPGNTAGEERISMRLSPASDTLQS